MSDIVYICIPDVYFELVELLLAEFHVALDFAELLQLFVGIRIQLATDVFHPHERSPILSPDLNQRVSIESN